MGRDYYIFSSGRIERKDNTIYFVGNENAKKAIPIEEVERIHLFGEIDLNTKFLNYISRFGILVNMYNYYGFYSGTYYSKKKNVSGLVSVNQSRVYLDNKLRVDMAKAFIDSANHHMIRNLRRHKEETEEYIRIITNERKLMNNAKTVQEVMGAEGRARAAYYKAFNEFLNEDFRMDKREKRPPNNPINALISFGNTIMYTTVLGEIYKTQLDPTISYLHEPSTKRFSLSLDIAEIFKPLVVDSVIFTMINKKMIKKTDFNIENEICYLNENGKKKFIRELENKLSTTVKHRTLHRNISYRNLIKLECYKIIKRVVEEEKYKPLKAWW